MSQRQAVHGKFGEEVLERLIAEKEYVSGEITDVIVEQIVEYGSEIGTYTHTGGLSYAQRRDKHIRGVVPNMYLSVYVDEVDERVLLDMTASEIVAFGEFSSVTGGFELTVEDVRVKVHPESLEIDGYGRFSRVEDVTDTVAYSSWNRQHGRVYEYGYKCVSEVESRLRFAWAKQNGIAASEWRIADVDESEYSAQATIEVESPITGDVLFFEVSVDDWDSNSALRKLLTDDGYGLSSNLEGETVVVSYGELPSGEAIAERKEWYLYRAGVRQNRIVRFLHSLQNRSSS